MAEIKKGLFRGFTASLERTSKLKMSFAVSKYSRTVSFLTGHSNPLGDWTDWTYSLALCVCFYSYWNSAFCAPHRWKQRERRENNWLSEETEWAERAEYADENDVGDLGIGAFADSQWWCSGVLWCLLSSAHISICYLDGVILHKGR